MHQKITQNIFKSLLVFLVTFGISNITFAAEIAGKGAPRTILPKLYMLDNMQIEAAQLGASKACHSSVKNYAVKLEADHLNHRGLVLAQAEKRNIAHAQATWSSAESIQVSKHQSNVGSLGEMNTCDFDSDFLLAMIDSHTFALNVVSSALTRENDADLRAFLQATQRALRVHHAEANRIIDILEKEGGEEDDQGDQDDGRQDDDQQDGQDGEDEYP